MGIRSLLMSFLSYDIRDNDRPYIHYLCKWLFCGRRARAILKPELLPRQWSYQPLWQQEFFCWPWQYWDLQRQTKQAKALAHRAISQPSKFSSYSNEEDYIPASSRQTCRFCHARMKVITTDSTRIEANRLKYPHLDPMLAHNSKGERNGQ